MSWKNIINGYQKSVLVLNEMNCFEVDESKLPKKLSKETYNFLCVNKGLILSNFYYFNGDKYIKNGNAVSNLDATKIYTYLYLQPRCIVWIEFGRNIGKEFSGIHPAVIIKNINNDILIVAPLSTDHTGTRVGTSTEVVFSTQDIVSIPLKNKSYNNITRICPVSICRFHSNGGSVRKPKYDELIKKIKKFY